MTANTTVSQSIAVADPEIPENVIKPNADGSINISGSISVSATTTAKATAAAPSYSEGVDEPLSQNLSGALRTLVSFPASVAVTQSGTWTVGISAAQTIAVTNAGTFAVQAAQATAANLNATVVGTGTFAVQAAQSGTWNIATVTTITGITTAFAATAASVPANAIQCGARGATANPTAVTDGQLVGVMADKVGRQAIVPYAVRDLVGQQTTQLSNTTSETTIVTAVASTFLDILSFNFSNTGSTATRVDIRDDTGGTVMAKFMVPAGDMRGQTYTVPFKQTATNKNWTAQCAAATTAMEITVQYVKNI